jgi:hypothetical protein
MDTLQNNASSEEFRNVPNSSEDFGSLRNSSERKENHILTVQAAVRMFEAAGVKRSDHSITNWCQPGRNGVCRLDCYYDFNERKYFITPQSVERAIEEEKSKIKSAELPNLSESFGNLPNSSEGFRNVPHASDSNANEHPMNQQNEKTNLSPDLVQELEDLRIEKRVWERERKFYDAWFTKVEKDRATVLPQIAELSKSVGYLEGKTEHLEKENQELRAISIPIRRQIIEQKPRSEDESLEDISRGDTADVVTD